MRDPWRRQATPRGPRTWAQQKRRFRAVRVPDEVFAIVWQWAGAPDPLEPLFRVVRDIAVSNAVYRARTKYARVAAGTAPDPHYKRIAEHPGALSPIVDIVQRVVADLERLITWEFTLSTPAYF